MVRLRPYRVNVASMTLEQLAERIREQGVPVTAAHLSNVELGHQRASDRLLAAWARALGLAPMDVWQRERAVEPVSIINSDDPAVA